MITVSVTRNYNLQFMVYNNTLHSGHNLTPYKIVFGRSGRIPIQQTLEQIDMRPLFQVISDNIQVQNAAVKLAVELQSLHNKKIQSNIPQSRETDT